ncbi:MAG TPA: PxKF domain-containing protein, partial [Vicinamibacteria bacterium]|nr:PxKF domain-containing protein [Vicinamibacteria bacterium]
ATVSVSGGTANNVGDFTADCAGATDVAGNKNQALASYSVHYDFTGFLNPVDNLPVVNSVKAGSSIPLKFSLAGDHGLDVLDGLSMVSIDCDSGAPSNEILPDEVSSAGNSGLTYDALTDQYIYAWKTEKSWGGACRTLQLLLDDGAIREAQFSFR